MIGLSDARLGESFWRVRGIASPYSLIGIHRISSQRYCHTLRDLALKIVQSKSLPITATVPVPRGPPIANRLSPLSRAPTPLARQHPFRPGDGYMPI